MKKGKRAAKSKDAPKVFISVTFGTETVTGSGDNVLHALLSMQRPVKIFTKGLLLVTDGARSAKVNLTVPRANRLFFPLAQPFVAKQLEYLMR